MPDQAAAEILRLIFGGLAIVAGIAAVAIVTGAVYTTYLAYRLVRRAIRRRAIRRRAIRRRAA